MSTQLEPQGTLLESIGGVLFRVLTTQEAALVLGGLSDTESDAAPGTGGVMPTYDSNGVKVADRELVTEATT